jgi:hypothetical protein
LVVKKIEERGSGEAAMARAQARSLRSAVAESIWR